MKRSQMIAFGAMGLGVLAGCSSSSGGNGADTGVTVVTSVATSVKIRLYNVDDVEDAYLNGTKILEEPYDEDSGMVDITAKLVSGANTLRLTATNVEALWSYGFDVVVNGTTVFSEECGMPVYGGATVGCNNDDPTIGLVFDHTVTLTAP